MKPITAVALYLLLMGCASQDAKRVHSGENYGADVSECQHQALGLYPAVDGGATSEKAIASTVGCMEAKGWKFQSTATVGIRRGQACRDRIECGSGEICDIGGSNFQGVCR